MLNFTQKLTFAISDSLQDRMAALQFILARTKEIGSVPRRPVTASGW